ncbi:MAG TPA: hypothetical protein VG753_01835, partial [Candidatus Paceibacterota bacterium]|nr:hypothetical protein [Candidatus Paceibacterota bacterium]
MTPDKKGRPSGRPSQDKKKALTGVIQLTRKGVGYLPWPDEPEKEDVEIQTPNLGGALNGDTVEVELTGLFPRPKGKVVKVIARAKEEFVATLREQSGQLVAIADDIKFYRPISLMDGSKYSAGEKVLVRLISFDGSKDPIGSITEHLGRAGEHRVEMNAIVLEHGFSTTFPEAVEAEARSIEENHAKVIEAELEKRTDFRDIPVFTIDPADAK